MKKSANSNMYEVSLEETWDRFGDHLDGARTSPVLVVSSAALPDKARNALASSVDTLGYGKEACTFLMLDPEGEPPCAGDARTLADTDLFSAIEGLDPLAVIIADGSAAQTCSHAYRTDIAVLDRGRLLGRDVVAFENFASMLDNQEDKRRAWGLLKRLPRLDS